MSEVPLKAELITSDSRDLAWNISTECLKKIGTAEGVIKGSTNPHYLGTGEIKAHSTAGAQITRLRGSTISGHRRRPSSVRISFHSLRSDSVGVMLRLNACCFLRH